MTEHFMAEFDELKVSDYASDTKREIARENAESLLSAIENFTGEKKTEAVLEIVEDNLKTKGTVGLIQTEDCSLEILPKIDVKCKNEKNRKNQVRSRLVHMISIAQGLIQKSTMLNR